MATLVCGALAMEAGREEVAPVGAARDSAVVVQAAGLAEDLEPAVAVESEVAEAQDPDLLEGARALVPAVEAGQALEAAVEAGRALEAAEALGAQERVQAEAEPAEQVREVAHRAVRRAARDRLVRAVRARRAQLQGDGQQHRRCCVVWRGPERRVEAKASLERAGLRSRRTMSAPCWGFSRNSGSREKTPRGAWMCPRSNRD